MLVCDKCRASIPEGAKFCGQCGDPVTAADRVNGIVITDQPANVEILFGYSSSVNYSKAVSICKNIPSYQETGEGKQIQHQVNLPLTDFELITNLFDLVGSWKTSRMLINGKPATKKDLTYGAVGCYRNRQNAHNPQQYCFGDSEYTMNIWGCTKLDMPMQQWGFGWLEHGNFDKSGVWSFDKQKIQAELEQKLNEFALCPALKRQQALAALHKLPDSVNPKQDKYWEYKMEYREVDGRHKNVATGVKPVTKFSSIYVDSDFIPKWDFEQQEENIPPAQETIINVTLEDKVQKEITPQNRKVGILLGIGLFFLPIIFYWLLLRKGHSKLARILWGCWLAAWVILPMGKP